jgi:aconitate hydratase
LPFHSHRRGTDYVYYSLTEAEKNGLTGISALPFSMKVLLENLLRHEDGRTVKKDDILAVAAWLTNKGKTEAMRSPTGRPAS